MPDSAAAHEARLDGILDASLDCIIAIDTAGNITNFNRAAEQTFGYQRADVLGREMAELIIPPALRERHRAGLKRLVETGQGAGMVGRRIEVNAMRADGSEVAVELTITRIEIAGEVFFVAYLRPDATARLQTRFTGILDAALDCIITIDHTGRITDFNSAAERTFGYSRAKAVGCELAELIVPPAYRERHRTGLRRLAETGKGAGIIGQRLELSALRADGSEFPVELAITQISTGGEHPFYTAYLRDISDRKRTEATLAANAAQQREARDYFEKSFNASPALMSIARANDGRIIAANPAFLRHSGYRREEVLEHTTEELGFWIQLERRKEFIDRIRTYGVVRDFEAQFRSKSGALGSLLINADLIELGGTSCIFAVCVDITERRRRDLIQAATYEISHAGAGGDDIPALCAKVHRIIGGLMSAKNFCVALLNADRSEISFPYFVDEIKAPPPPRVPSHGTTELVLERCEPIMGTTAEITALLKKQWPNETPRPVRCAQWVGAPLMVEGRSIGMIAVRDYQNPNAYGLDDQALLTFVADQTAAAVQRRESDAARRRAEEQYRSIFENSLEGLYQTAPDGRFLQANPAIVRILGFPSLAELFRARWEGIYVDPGQRERIFQRIQHTDELTNFESEVYRYDGTRIWISESVRVMRAPNGAVDHFEAAAVNITAEREAAQALQRAKEEADAASRAKSTFLASMSHELRTPLNGVLGYAQILRRDKSLNPKQSEAVAVIQASAEHLLSLINDVLDLSKIEARKLELLPSDFGLKEFAQAIVQIFVPRAREKNLQLETEFAADLPQTVRGDEQRLRQVILNLLGNAIKFTTQGSVTFCVERAAHQIRISIRDTGPGITAEDQARLFQPFTQVGDRHQRTGGSGLGLAISRSIVEQMGGHLELESQPGVGTRFWFDLPLEICDSPFAPQPLTALAHITGYEGPRRRVLVADDRAANRSVLVDLLTPLGFEVITANDGEEAIAAATRPTDPPDLVLLDLRMPRVDGLAAARAINGAYAARNARPPVIVGVSASAFNVDRQTFLAGGCADFIAKPFREEHLLGLIGHHLGLTWTRDGIPQGETQFLTRSAVASTARHSPPPAADLEELFRLASNGDVLGVRAYAEDLRARDAALGAFCREVIELAARYKMKAIRQLLARYRS
jgi:PAS domain S-box-containing protein